jgi:hypothetical protein
MLHSQPFKRLRVFVSSGAIYEVPHPDFADTRTEGLVITASNSKGATFHEVVCSWLHISNVESF